MSRVILALLPFLVACAAPRSPQQQRADEVRARLVAIDPVFGGGELLVRRLTQRPRSELIGEPIAVERFLRNVREQADADATERVRELVPDPLALELADVVFTKNYAAACGAEAQALVIYPLFGGELVGLFTKLCTELAAKEMTGQQRFREIQREFGEGSVSLSPVPLAVLVGLVMQEAAQHPVDLAAIAAFHSSPLGQRWQSTRSLAIEDAKPDFHTAYASGEAQGLWRYLDAVMDDLVLPKAEFTKPAEPGEVETRPVIRWEDVMRRPRR